MSLLENDTTAKRGLKPHDRVRLTPSLVAALWQYRDEQGQSRVGWSLDCHNEENPDSPRRICQEHQVLELGQFAQKLSLALARRPSLPMPLRMKLAAFANAMAQADEILRSDENGEDDSERPEGKRVLAFD